MQRNSTHRLIALTSAIGLFAGALAVSADADALVANDIGMQGRLLSSAGTAVPDGTYAMTIRFYQAAAGGPVLHMVTLAKVTVKGGLFSSAINAKTPHFHTGKAAWVGIKIGIDPELPRVALHKVPYAIRADSAVTLDGLHQQ